MRSSELPGMFDEEGAESKKRVSCIGGIFQLFDCQQLLGQGHRRGGSGHAQVSPSNQRPGSSSSCSSKKNQIRRSQENPRDSMESSRTSFSSSFTSFSSFEHKSPQDEQMYPHNSFFSRSPGNSPRNSPSSPALKDIIKESIYKGFRNTNEDDSKINGVTKPNKSQRPTDLCKLNDLDESLRVLFKLKEIPRFSYDGAEISQTFIEMKQASALRELSRLSLDSKEDSLRSNLSPRFKSVLKLFDKNDDRRAPAAMNQIQDMEINQRSPGIVAKLMGLEPLDGNMHEKPLQSPRNTANVNEKIESLMEKKLKMVQLQNSSTELRKLKREIIETRKNGNTDLSSTNSKRAQHAPPKHKWNKVSSPEGAFKSPIVIMEPARKFNVSFLNGADLGGPTGLGKIRTSCSSNRKKDTFNEQINTVSSQLQQIKPTMKKKASSSIPTYDSKYLGHPENSQTPDSVSPRGKIRHKSSQEHGNKLQNSGDQANVEALGCYRSFEHKSLCKQSIQGESIKAGTRDSVSEAKRHSVAPKELSSEEIELVFSSQQSCPNSALDNLLRKDGLPHSPASVSNLFNEYQDLPSDCSFNMECLPQTQPSTFSSRNNPHKKAWNDKMFHEASVLGRTNEELYATEIIQDSGNLHDNKGLFFMLDKIDSENPFKSDEKSKADTLHQNLVSDMMEGILELKIEASSSCECKIKCYQSCKERKDENPLIHKNMPGQPQAWNSFKSAVPVLVLEIERLIFKDLINEVVNGETAVVHETKQKQ